jgi:hypothetical protein
MKIYEFHPLAARELEEAVSHYESLAPGKGLELARQVKKSIYRIGEFPESAPLTRGQVRSILIQPSARWHFTRKKIYVNSAKLLAAA